MVGTAITARWYSSWRRTRRSWSCRIPAPSGTARAGRAGTAQYAVIGGIAGRTGTVRIGRANRGRRKSAAVVRETLSMSDADPSW